MDIKTKAKLINFKDEHLTNKILKTMSTLSNIVGVTLGPGGNPVLIERPGLAPLITKDGVTVADAIALKDATEHVIAEAAKEACQKTNREAGDGTTTAIVLAQSITEYGMKFLQNNPTKSPQQLCRELDKVIEDVTTTLTNGAMKIFTEEELRQVAMISSNSDEDVADAVVEAVDMVGDDGTIVTEEGGGRFTKVELREGFPVNKGLSFLGAVQELFINNPADQECVFDTPDILLYDGDLNIPQELGTFLHKVFMEMGNEVRPVVVVAHKFSPQVIQMAAVNVKANRAALCLLETVATAQPNSKHHFLHDLAAFIGAKVYDPIANTFSKAIANDKYVVLPDLGSCEKVRIGRYQSFFFGADDATKITERINILKTQMKNAESDYDAEIIKERISQLSGGIATIYVGGASELEMREKKHRIEDAINSVRSAIEAGVVPGGGAALLAMAHMIQQTPNKTPSADILVGAFGTPFARIMINSGATSEDVGKAAELVVASIKENSKMPSTVFDSLKHSMVNPYDVGIIDPVKVVISAVKNAYSIAKMLMTTGGTIVIPRDAEEEKQSELQAQAFASQMQGA